MRSKLLIMIGICLFIGAFGVKLYLDNFHVGKSEKEFISSLQKGLKAGGTKVLLRDITSFKWNRVCMSSQSDDLGHFVSPAITQDQELQKLIARNYVSWVFFENGDFVKLLGFQKSYKITVGASRYDFLDHFDGNICKSNVDAAFWAQTKGSVSKIVYTSKDKGNDPHY